MKTLRLSLSEILGFAGAEKMGAGLAGLEKTRVCGISTDSRTVAPGEVFVALQGPAFNGHDHIKAALDKGAIMAISHEPFRKSWNGRAARVGDTLRALGEIAKNIRLKQKVKVVALTGSNGKTTTKEMLAAILVKGGPMVATRGNLNNLIGLPQTIFRLEKNDRLAVLEMGMNHFGEIARLTEIARPDVGLITSVGAAHLEFFGKTSEVAKAKGELFQHLPAGAVAVVNNDEPLLVKEARKFSGNKLTFGLNGDVTIKNVRSKGLAGQSFKIYGPGVEKGLLVEMKLLGLHNAHNALAAAAAALAAGADWSAIVEGLGEAENFPGRLSSFKSQKGYWIIDDSYNANPDSVLAGLNFLASLKGRAPKAAILGDMLELGEQSAALHKKIGRAAAGLKLDYLAGVGPLSENTLKAARAAGFSRERLAHFDKADDAAGWAKGLPKGARIFIKGSRGIRLDETVNLLKND